MNTQTQNFPAETAIQDTPLKQNTQDVPLTQNIQDIPLIQNTQLLEDRDVGAQLYVVVAVRTVNQRSPRLTRAVTYPEIH